MEDINKKLSAIKDGLEEKIDQKIGLSLENLGDDYKSELKGEVSELITKRDETITDLNKRIDTLEVEGKKALANAPSPTFKAELSKNLAENSEFKSFLNGNSNKATLNIKATMVTSLNASGNTVPASVLPGFYFDPTRTVRVRDFLPTIPTASNTVRYVQEIAYTNNAGARIEGSAFGESDFRLDAVDAPVRSIGSYMTLTKEMLNDIPQLTSYISTRLPAKVLNKEDDQLLNGAGTGVNLQGLMTSGGGTAFITGASGKFYEFYGAGASAFTNEFDVLTASVNQAMVLEYSPNLIMTCPTDYHKMFLRKDNNNNYVVFTNGVLTLLGIPIVQSNAVTEGKFIVGDFQQGATLAQREGMEIAFAEQNEANFIKDLVTVKATERIALPIHNPNAFVHGTFSTAIASMNA